MKLTELTAYMDGYLRISDVPDHSNNGLQVEGAPDVERIAFAVDACLTAFEGSRDAGAQMLVVHHGLYWNVVKLITRLHYRQLKTLLDADVGLYAVHLPLDMHPEVGNNAELFRLLSLHAPIPFGQRDGFAIGVGGEVRQSESRDAFTRRFGQALGIEPLVLPFGRERVRRVAVCSGSASPYIEEAARSGYDTFVTGETEHTFYHDAKDYGINILYGGHYATETVGLKALARHLEDRFDLETTFLDIPTGM